MGTQALSNMLTGNPMVQQVLWVDYMGRGVWDDFLSSLVTCNDDPTLTGALVLTYNCIHESRERSECLHQTESGRRLFTAMLQQAEPLLENEDSRSFELIYAITRRLIDFDLFSSLFDALKSVEGASFTLAQITLLKLLDSKIHASASTTIVPTPAPLPLPAVRTLAQSFNAASSRATLLMRGLPPAIPLSSPQPDDEVPPDEPISVEDTANLYTGLVLQLQCFWVLSLEEAGEARSALVEEGILASCCALLAQADVTIPRITKSAMNPPSTPTYVTDTSTARGSAGVMYIKRDVVRVLGNLAAGDQAVQDEIRQLGGISLVLNQCNIDDANPYIREHAIFALRNLLAGNAENQALIAEMTPLDAAQNPVLRDIGLRAEMGEGGKVRVRVAEEKRERGP